MLSAAVAVSVAIVRFAAVAPRFSVAPAPCTSSPVPVSAVLAVRVPVLVSAMPVTATFGIVKIPARAWLLVSNVCAPLPDVKLPPLAIPPRNVAGEVPEFHVPPALIATAPLKILVPVALEMFKTPLVPSPTVVAPATVSA